jgi:hypothetical protein
MLSAASNSSNNILNNQPTTATSGSSPPSMYHPHMPYTKWISAWTSSLLPKAQGPKLALFIACRGVVKDDLRTSHYLLPYLLLHVLVNGTEEDREGIKGEMLAVLNDCVGMSPARGGHGGSGSSESAQLSTQKVVTFSSFSLYFIILCLFTY